MDGDGQNDPADIVPMSDMVLAGRADFVSGIRVRREDPWWKRMQARLGNVVRNTVTGDRIRDTGGFPKVGRREILLRVPRFDGMHRYLPSLVRFHGARVVEMPVAHRPRRHGRSKYGAWRRLLVGSGDVLGVRWLGRRRLSIDVEEERLGP